MNVFPTQYSTLSSVALKDHIKLTYGLEVGSCRLLIRNVSDVYILEDLADKYIFKIYRDSHRRLGEIMAEVELLDILKAGGCPVSYPIRDLTDGAIQQFNAAEGIRNGVLFSFAKGKVFPDPGDRQLEIAANGLVSIHDITADCVLRHPRITYDVATTVERPLQLIAHRFAEMPDEFDFLRGAAAKAIGHLDRPETAAFSYGYCHYDLLPKNFHFDEHDRITFFDFDWTGRGFLVNDLMTLFVQYFFLIHFKMITPEEAGRKFMVFVDAYRRRRPLSGEELAAIPALGIMYWIYAFGFYEDNFDDFSNTFLTPKFIRDRVALIKKWVDTSPGLLRLLKI